jgi:hypothetical protein
MQEAGTLIDQEQLDELKDELHVPSKYIWDSLFIILKQETNTFWKDF